MKDSYLRSDGKRIEREVVIFEAEDVNDPTWNKICKILKENGIDTYWCDGNYMNFVIERR